MTFKIATWNVNSIKMRLEHLLELIKIHDPDVICLQELKCETAQFPHKELEHLPYNFYIHGQKSYNGVAILSKFQADEITTEFPENPLPNEARFIQISADTPMGYARIISLYAPNGGEVGSDKFANKLVFYDAFAQYLDSAKSFDEKIFIGSDYNIAPFDIDVYSPKNLENSTCFTLQEKEKLRTILNSGFSDHFRAIHPLAQEFSWWDYRAGAFSHNKGMRIDSIISTSNALPFLQDCFIDHSFREKEKPSDHAPVISVSEGRHSGLSRSRNPQGALRGDVIPGF